MTSTVTVVSAMPLRSGADTGILTYVNEQGVPGTAKYWLADAFAPGELVEVEIFEMRRESVDRSETWAKRMSARDRKPAHETCLVRAAVDLVMHSTPPGTGVDMDQIRDVVTALEVALVSPR